MRCRADTTPVRTLLALASAVLTIGAALGVAGCTARPADPNSCSGQTIDRSAPVISGGEVLVAAPVDRVWAVHTDVAAYPTWKGGVAYSQRLDPGPLRVGSQFRWTNGPLPIVSSVRAIEADRCTLWSGPASGIDGVHLWTFTPVAGGTLVHTEESWSGPPVAADPARTRALLDQALSQGRADLERKLDTR